MISDDNSNVSPIGPLPLYQGWAPTTCGRWVFYWWTDAPDMSPGPYPRRRPRKPGKWRVCLGQVADTAEEAYAHSDRCGVRLRREAT